VDQACLIEIGPVDLIKMEQTMRLLNPLLAGAALIALAVPTLASADPYDHDYRHDGRHEHRVEYRHRDYRDSYRVWRHRGHDDYRWRHRHFW
jgi:hypothetical protein